MKRIIPMLAAVVGATAFADGALVPEEKVAQYDAAKPAAEAPAPVVTAPSAAAATPPTPPKPAAPPKWMPTLNGMVILRYDDVSSWAQGVHANHYASLWYKDLKEQGLFNYSARLGASGKLSDQVSYGVRLMFRNYNRPAFSYPAYEPGFANSMVVADQFYLSLQPTKALTISIGKHPMMMQVYPNFFWDLDVQPVGASERYELPLPSSGDLKHTLGFNLGQWLPLVAVRAGPSSNLFLYQAYYDMQLGGATGYSLLVAADLMHWNGFDRFLANSTIGGGVTYRTDPKTGNTVSVPNNDFQKGNDATMVGYNPTWVEGVVKAQAKSIGGRPLSVNLFYTQNLHTASLVDPKWKTDQNYGYSLGLSYGAVKKQFDWSVGYEYQMKGIAAFINGWTDDSFGADLKGHVVTLQFMPADGATLIVMWRLLSDADGLDNAGKPSAYANANLSIWRVMLSGKF